MSGQYTATYGKKFRFIGDTQEGVGYVDGSVYSLFIEEPGFLYRLFGGHLNWKVTIISPIFCPYESWESFNQNWQEITE